MGQFHVDAQRLGALKGHGARPQRTVVYSRAAGQYAAVGDKSDEILLFKLCAQRVRIFARGDILCDSSGIVRRVEELVFDDVGLALAEELHGPFARNSSSASRKVQGETRFDAVLGYLHRISL